MFRCLNPGNIGVRLDWRACLPLARKYDFEGIDLPIDPQVSAAEYTDALAAHTLKPGGMGLPLDWRGDEAKFQASLAKLDAIAARASEVGVRRFYTWILSFSDTLSYRENMKFHAARLGPAARVLAAHGCTLGVEFLGPKTIRDGHKYSFIQNVQQGLDLAAAIGLNAGLLLDAWHWFTAQATVEDILALEPEQVVYVHINDAPPGIPLSDRLDNHRAVPGETGVIDLGAFLGALRRIGYEGPVVPEPFVPELGQMAPEDAIKRVGAALKRVWLELPRPAVPAKMQVVVTAHRKAWLVEQPTPRPQGSEVIVKVHAAPLCGSNIGAFVGEQEVVNVGHEAAGEVVAVAESRLLKVGDRVALAPLSACGVCPQCLEGDTIFCTELGKGMGRFSQYTRVLDLNCTKLPAFVDYDHGSLLGCCLGPAYAATKRLNVRAFDTLVVGGLGPVGLGAVALATFNGARVVAYDPEPYRREIAVRLGAHLVLDPAAADFREQLAAALGPARLQKAVECSGRPDSELLLCDLAGIHGQVAIVGENHNPLPLKPSEHFIRKGLTVFGCWHMNVLDAPDLLAFLSRAPLKADLLITHRFPLAQAQAAFETFLTRQAVKVILHPWA